jgi:sugar lactone lactonase YvrE
MKKSCSFRQLMVAFTLVAMLLSVCARAQDIFIPVSSLNTIVRLPAVSGSAVTFASSGLNEPEGVAFDGPGNLYVVNFGNSTVEKFAYTNGALSASGTVFASTGLNNPSAIAIDQQGNVYVGNDGNNTVEKFSAAGTDLGVFASANIRDPQGLAFDDNGNLYVGNLLLNTIEKFSPAGADLGVFASGFSSLRGLGFFEGNLYAVDFGGTGSVQIFTPDGKSNGTLTTGLNQPWSVAFDNSGVLGTTNVVYVANNGNKSIERYDNGSAFGNRSTGTANLAYIAVEPAVHTLPRNIQIFVSNANTNNILKFNSSGGSVFVTNGNSSSLEGVALDASGNLYVAEDFGFTIEKYSPTGADLGTFANSGLNQAAGLAFDTNGNLYVANFGNNTVEKFTDTGGTLSTNGTVFASTGLDNPFAIAVDTGGNVYVLNDSPGTIEKFSSTGADLGVFASSVHDPQGLAVDSGGNLYLANEGNSTIEKFSSTGADLGAFASSGLNDPVSLAFDSSGTLYVGNRGDNTLEGFNAAGQGTLYANSGLNYPAFIVAQTIQPVAPPLRIQLFGTNVVLTWTDPELLFSLQSASSVTGAYVKVNGAVSPFTNSAAGSQKFFRLQGN